MAEEHAFLLACTNGWPVPGPGAPSLTVLAECELPLAWPNPLDPRAHLPMRVQDAAPRTTSEPSLGVAVLTHWVTPMAAAHYRARVRPSLFSWKWEARSTASERAEARVRETGESLEPLLRG